MSNITLAIGICAEEHTIVTEGMTAEKLGSGDIPVYATPAMIAFMEQTAKNMVKKHLAEGETTVGTKISVSHEKASIVGEKIRAEVTLVNVDGRMLLFDVVAYDSHDHVIGKGEHSRFIVDEKKFMEKLK